MNSPQRDPATEYERQLHEWYLNHHRTLLEIETDQTRSFDKAVLTVASGALALSLTFAERIAPLNPTLVCLLYSSWACFCLAILSTTLSFLLAGKSAARQREIFTKDYESHEAGGEALQNRWSKWVDCLNVLSLLLVVSGVAFLTLYAILNFEHRIASQVGVRDEFGHANYRCATESWWRSTDPLGAGASASAVATHRNSDRECRKLG